MGDRTNVTLAVALEHLDALRATVPDEDFEFGEPDDTCTDTGGVVLALFEFGEINYADLGIEQLLRMSGIPYNKTWSQGDEYTSGSEWFRLKPERGQYLFRQIYDDEQWFDAGELKERLDDHKALKTYILDRTALNTCPPFDQAQLDRHKIWKLEKLITSD